MGPAPSADQIEKFVLEFLPEATVGCGILRVEKYKEIYMTCVGLSETFSATNDIFLCANEASGGLRGRLPVRLPISFAGSFKLDAYLHSPLAYGKASKKAREPSGIRLPPRLPGVLLRGCTN